MSNRRHYNRIIIGQKATLAAKYFTIDVIIDDLSETGVSVSTYSSPPLIECGPDTLLALEFQPSVGETLTLHCRVKWIDEFPSHGSRSKKRRIGMEIINPPWDQSKSFL